MLGLARLIIVGFVVLTIIYLCLSWFSRSVRRRKLEEEWHRNPVGDKEAFVEEGLEDYDGSLRRKLIWGVYVVPTLLVVLIIYINNFA
jgi:hypothetical protein